MAALDRAPHRPRGSGRGRRSPAAGQASSTLWNLDHRTIERETRCLYACSMRLLHDPAFAQDAVQETRLAGLRYAESFDDRRSSKRTWLTAILRRKIVDLLRRKTKEGVLFEERRWREISRPIRSFM